MGKYKIAQMNGIFTGGEKMDAKLVEEITRLVLSKLENYSESSAWKGRNNQNSSVNQTFKYPPLTDEEVKEWNEISSALRYSTQGNEVPSYQVPLTIEELKIWNDLSASIGYRRSDKSKEVEQPKYVPLTDEEIKGWSIFGGNKSISVKKEPEGGRVKFFPYQ
jgi:hypothetical protein